MRFRSDLERLTTLDAETITRACTDRAAIAGIVTYCLDESLELDDLAERAAATGDDDHAGYYRQEAAAWRATVTVLRTMGATDARGTAGRRRGVA